MNTSETDRSKDSLDLVTPPPPAPTPVTSLHEAPAAPRARRSVSSERIFQMDDVHEA